jgi:tetratricopeptide (TPR) repeat protein
MTAVPPRGRLVGMAAAALALRSWCPDWLSVLGERPMQGFAARILLTLGLALTLCAPSAAQNRRVVTEAEACRALCIANPEYTAWSWRNEKAGPIALHCFLSNGTDFQKRASNGHGVSGVIQGAAADAQNRVTNSPQSIADYEKHCANTELSSKAIIQNCSIFIERGLLSGSYLAGAYNTRGIGYDEEGKTDLAISDYRRSIELNPDQSNAYFNMAVLYFAQGDLLLALKYFDEAIARGATDAGTHTRRGAVLLQLARYSDAI